MMGQPLRRVTKYLTSILWRKNMGRKIIHPNKTQKKKKRKIKSKEKKKLQNKEEDINVNLTVVTNYK